MYDVAKKAREALKSKARRLASTGTLKSGQDTTSATWSPAEALNADVKTGARPVGKARLYNRGGKVSGDKSAMRADRKRRATGGKVNASGKVEKEIGNAMVNKDVRAANEEREGIKHIGGFKKGGKIARKTGGSVPSDKETGLNKERVGEVQVKPKRGPAQNYKKGGTVKRAEGGKLPSPEEAIGSEERLKGLRVMPGKSSTPAAEVMPAQLRREEGYARADMRAKRKYGGKAKKADGGGLPSPEEAVQSEARMKGLRVEKAPSQGFSREQQRSYKREEGYSAADMKATRPGRKSGGRAKSKPTIVVKIETGKQAPMMGGMGAVPPVPPVPPMPPVPPAAGAPMGPGAVPPIPGMGGGPAGFKSGGRITKVAKSYKDMEAGAASGEGRLQKTDIESRHTDAPARKAGGRVSKVARSYKDMTAGSESGEGRLQKMDIAKAKRARAA